ncbi:MAG TPA: glycoside hydrolase family 2, partial [Porphyromonadaceae bacterium]|nr:glycoside hydrolase family 2 [Porphyromonadaceae bacterium]
QILPNHCYNNADEIELFVNGESQGVRKPEPGKYHASWRVDFTPGTVKAVSRKDGRIVATDEIRTAGEPYRIRLTPDRSSIKADGNDLSYVLVEILDKDGNLCPWADNLVTFDVTGSGRNEGVDNGSPISLERFKDNKRKAFYGKAMLIVRNDNTQGPATVRATSPGLLPYTTVINSF